jgi:hypothetical protein
MSEDFAKISLEQGREQGYNVAHHTAKPVERLKDGLTLYYGRFIKRYTEAETHAALRLRTRKGQDALAPLTDTNS